MNHSQQYRQAYAQLRREGLDPRAAMAQAGASVGFPGEQRIPGEPVFRPPSPVSHMVPQFAERIRQRREQDRDGDGDGHDDDDDQAAAELLVLENANFDTDDEVEYDWVDDYSKTGKSFFAGLGMTQLRAVKRALVHQRCVGLEYAYMSGPDGGSPNPNEYVDYHCCGEPFASAQGDEFVYLQRESVLTEFVYREFPSSDGFDEFATSCLRDFGEGVFEMLVDLARETQHGYFPITSVLMLRAVELHMMSIGAASAELPFAVRARASHLRADVLEDDDDDDASMRPSDLDSESSLESVGEIELEGVFPDESEAHWHDRNQGLQFYPGEPGAYDMYNHVGMWNTSPYRSRFLSARATALGIDDLDLSLDVPASLLRAWPVLRLGDRGYDGPTFEMYACYTNRALDIFAKSARRWLAFRVIAHLQRTGALRAVERLPAPLFAHVLELAFPFPVALSES